MQTKTTADFIADLKAKHGLRSNYAVAKFLKQTDTAVARWAHGKGSFSDETAMHIADLLDLDPAYVVACVHAERAKRTEEKKLWEHIATLTMGAMVGLMVFALASLPFLPLNGGVRNVAMAEPMYIMLNLLRTYWPAFLALLVLAFAGRPRHDPREK